MEARDRSPLLVIYLLLANKAGNFTVRPAYQTANIDPSNPNAPTPIGAATGTAGDHTFSVAPTVSSAMWIRTGVMIAYTSTAGAGDVTVKPYWYTGGKAIGDQTLQVYPGMLDASTPAIIPVTGWIPAANVSKVMAVIKLIDNLTASSIKTRLCYRAAINTNDPCPWELMEAGYNMPSISGTSMRNTGELTFGGTGPADITANVKFQIGIALLLNSGTVRATVQVITAAIYG